MNIFLLYSILIKLLIYQTNGGGLILHKEVKVEDEKVRKNKIKLKECEKLKIVSF